MSTTDEENVLEKLIESLVSEALRGFNMEQFKMLHDTDSMRRYAAKMLPHMGEGSARTVYALSNSKALKIALDAKGLAQNKAEVDVYTNPRIKPIVTRIFDADTTRYTWVVAEIVQPLTASDNKMFEQSVGMDFNNFLGVVTEWYNDGRRDPETFFKERLENLRKNFEFTKKDFPPEHWRVKDDLLVMSIYEKAMTIPLVIGVITLIQQGVEKGDLIGHRGVIGHYGKTLDGRIVVLDYGYTAEVRYKHYTSW